MSTIGRPTSYEPAYCQLAHNYCLLGATNERLGEFFGVTPRTIDNWIARIPEFADAVQRGRNIADATVAESLYRRAVGYEHEVECVVVCRGKPRIVKYKKCYPPETQAAKHWLRNRRPQNWGGRVRAGKQEKREVEASRIPAVAAGNEPKPPSPAHERAATASEPCLAHNLARTGETSGGVEADNRMPCPGRSIVPVAPHESQTRDLSALFVLDGAVRGPSGALVQALAAVPIADRSLRPEPFHQG